MKRREYLEAAEKCVCSDRERQYGSPENSFKEISKWWNLYLYDDYKHEEISPYDVAVMMALLKVARLQSGRFKDDSIIDAIGYLACAGEIGSRGSKSDA